MAEDLIDMVCQPPRVTVLMPVFNGARYLREAIESILNQTFTDFEFLIINDGSTDDSGAIISSYNDPRIIIVSQSENLGLISCLNRGLELAKGEYIVRMDADDFCLPGRIERQVSFMAEHPEVGICGVWYWEFGKGTGAVMRCPVEHDSIMCGTLFNPVVGHPSVIFRTSCFRMNNLRYDPVYRHAEDYALWAQALKCCRFANLGEVLLLYRVHENQVTQNSAEIQMQSAGRVRYNLLQELGLCPDNEEFEIHQMLSALTRPIVFKFEQLSADCQLEKIDAWLCKLKKANDMTGVYPEPLFSKMLIERWIGVCYLNILAKGKFSPRLFASPAIFKITGRGWRLVAEFILKRIIFKCSDIYHSRRYCSYLKSLPGVMAG